MPMSIRPAGNPKEKEDDLINYFPFNLDLNSGFLTIPAKKKIALASDGDAEILFNVWENSSVIRGDEDNKVYKVGFNIDKDDILKLKSSGLIFGSEDEISFTNKGVSIIKTLVLGEQNYFSKNSIKKPYSVIFAEQQAPKRKSALALASIDLSIEQKATINYPEEIPSQDRKYVYNKRLISKGIASEKSAKEYNVRIYKSKDPDEFELWCFNGKINGTQRAHYKGTFSLDKAQEAAELIIHNKTSGDSKYNYAKAYDIPDVNSDIPGKSTTEKSIPRKSPAKKDDKKTDVFPEHTRDFEKKVDEIGSAELAKMLQ